jgi:tetratricopeptide (TPR) repeat protein
MPRLLGGLQIIYAHLTPTVATGASVGSDRPIGIVESLPAVQSVRHQNRLLSARRLYAQGRFNEAAELIKPTLSDEPENPFLLNELGRALFRVDSLRSYSRRVYQHLVELLSTRQAPPPNGLVIDMWFVDAYWKLGMLDLDAEAYDSAARHLTINLLASPADPAVQEQLYAYLAEAYFSLGDGAAADWFAQRTLSINPSNQYVLRFRSSH